MTRLSNRLFLLVITIFTLIYIQSCEKDFTSIDSDVINSENAIKEEKFQLILKVFQ